MTITGPFTRTKSDVPQLFDWSLWYRQNPKRLLPLAYQKWRSQTNPILYDDSKTNAIYGNMNFTVGSTGRNADHARIVATALNKAYAKYLDKLYERVELGLNIAERRQSMDMIAQRALQLRKAWNSLVKGDFRAFKRELGLSSGGKRWSRPDQASRLWLEYHFGWEQLVKDIYDLVHYLDQGWPRKLSVKGKASAEGLITLSKLNSNGTGTDSWYKFQAKVTMGAKVSVTDPSAYTLTTLGLINPATLAWERIPFSFVADWFVPVGQYLNSFTDHVGLSVDQPYTTLLQVAYGQRQLIYGPVLPSPGVQEYSVMKMERVLNITRPQLKLKMIKGISPVRAATSISLLIQAFRQRLLK
jgi:hypothetical protein